MNRSCSTCENFCALDNSCRAAPPTTVIVPGPTAGQIRVMAVFPSVSATQWCGQYRRDATEDVTKPD